jgi:hypothetical protein
MKKLFLAIFAVITLLFAANLETKAQNALLVQGGYSWSEGVVAAGYQFGGLSALFGYMPAKMPGDGSSVSGLVFNLKLGPEWDESGYYVSYSYNSVGYRSQYSTSGGSWSGNYVEGMNILSLGYKVGDYSWYLSGDIGYGWSASGKGMSWGIVLGFPLFGM